MDRTRRPLANQSCSSLTDRRKSSSPLGICCWLLRQTMFYTLQQQQQQQQQKTQKRKHQTSKFVGIFQRKPT